MHQDKISAAIAKTYKARIATQTDEIYNSLVVEANNKVIPEDLFKNYFLPHFSGHAPISINSKVMTEWIGIAGTPTSEVDVADASGQVIFTVPSLFDTNIIDAMKRKVGESFHDIYNEFELRNNNIPVVANNFLNNELSKKLAIVDTGAKDPTIAGRWDSIFARYGVIPASSSLETVQQDDPSDDLDYS